MSDQQSREIDWRWMAAVLLAAFALRAAAVWHWRSELTNDRDGYRAIADHVLKGHGFATAKGRPTAYRPPLYPLVLSVVDVLGGRWGIATMQVLLGVGTVWLTLLIGRQLGMERGAIAAAGLVAVDPLLLRYTPQVMTETLFTFLVVLLLCLIVRGDARSSRRAVCVGFVFGLCALCRPTVWAFGAIAGVAWLVRNRRRWVGEGLVAVGVCGLVVSPWLVRNVIVFGRPILTTTHGGYTLLLGNNPVFYDEVVRQPWGTVWQLDSLKEWQRSLDDAMRTDDPPPETEPERDRWHRQRALANIGDDPAGFTAACWLRFRRFWNVAPVADASSHHIVAVWSIGAFYSLLSVGALIGLYRLRKTEWRRWWPLIAVVGSFTAVHLVYWSNARMRAPLIPIVALLCIRGMSFRRDSVSRLEETADVSQARR